jgi:hypothetical protein
MTLYALEAYNEIKKILAYCTPEERRKIAEFIMARADYD